jgi:(p)ppGpp synthase/HD superfamily hydrolase
MEEMCMTIAQVAHEGQRRTMGDDFGKAYIIHPARVAGTLDSEDLKCIAWLHDVIEDSALKAEDLISVGVPAHIVAEVVRLTKKPGESYLNYLERVMESWLATEVKLADIYDNLNSLPDGNLKDKYTLAIPLLEERLGL